MIGYSDTSGSSSLLGSDTASTSANRNFSALSTYRLAGFFLNGGFIHVSTDANITGLENGEAETTSGSSNQYRLSANRSLPYNRSSFSIGLSRGSYSSNDSLGGESNGTTDTANVNVGLMFPKLPVVVTAYLPTIFLAVSNSNSSVAGKRQCRTLSAPNRARYP